MRWAALAAAVLCSGCGPATAASFYDRPSGGGGGGGVPQFAIDFTALGTYSKTGTGAWAGVSGIPSLNVNSLSGDNAGMIIDGAGLRPDGTTGVGSVDFDAADLGADIDLKDGATYAFLLEFDSDPAAGNYTALMAIGSDLVAGDPAFPQLAGITRESALNRVKYFQGRGLAYINDHIDTVAGGSVEVSALGLIITNQQGTGYYQGDATHTAPGKVYPALLNNNGNAPMQNNMGLGTFVYNKAGAPTRIQLGSWAGVNMTRLTCWAVDYNLVNP